MSTALPHTSFTIEELHTETITEQLLSGELDIGIASIPLENDELLEYPIYEEEFFVYDCGKDQASKKYTVSDIDLDRLWLMEEGHCLRNQVGKICELREKKKMKSNLVYNCGSIYTLVEMVKKSRGVTLLPRMAFIKNKQIDQKNIYSISDPVPSRKIGLVTHRNFVNRSMLDRLSRLIELAIGKQVRNQGTALHFIKPF